MFKEEVAKMAAKLEDDFKMVDDRINQTTESLDQLMNLKQQLIGRAQALQDVANIPEEEKELDIIDAN